MPIARKTLYIVYQNQTVTCLVKSTDALASLATQECIPGLLPRTLRVLQQRFKDLKECIVVIDDLPQYHSLITEDVKTKEDLLQLWDLEGKLLAYTCTERQGQRVYCGYSYAQAIIQPYLAILKKQGLLCRGIVPLDFLYHGEPLIVVQEADPQLRVRVFDGRAGIYTAMLFRSKQELIAVAHVLQYALREQLIAAIPTQQATTLPAPVELLTTEIQPTTLLYVQESQHLIGARRWSSKQKTALLFVAMVLAVVAIMGILIAVQIGALQKEIAGLRHQAYLLQSRVMSLRIREKNTLWLRHLTRPAAPEVVAVLQYMRAQHSVITELVYIPEKKLLSVVALDSGEGRNAVIKACKHDPAFSAVNLIYIRPQGKYLEYKLIVTVR